jgi:hypothetical protein
MERKVYRFTGSHNRHGQGSITLHEVRRLYFAQTKKTKLRGLSARANYTNQ